MFLLSWLLRGQHGHARPPSAPTSCRPSLENLEDRSVPAAPSIIALGSSAGSVVDVYDAASGQFKYEFQAFEASFAGPVRVAVGNNHGQDILAVAAGPGGFLVRTFVAGPSGATPMAQFEPFGTFDGGLNVAVGDLNGDGGAEVVTGADAAPDGFPLINVHDILGNLVSPYILAYETGFHGGVRVGVGDFTGTGQDDIIAAAGPGGLPFVEIINGRTFQIENRFLAFDPGFTDGTYVAGGQLDHSGVDRIVVGAGGGQTGDFPFVREFDSDGNLLREAEVFSSSYHGGVAVGTAHALGQSEDVILASAPDGNEALALDSSFNTLRLISKQSLFGGSTGGGSGGSFFPGSGGGSTSVGSASSGGSGGGSGGSGGGSGGSGGSSG
jgi:hypothetical protein